MSQQTQWIGLGVAVMGTVTWLLLVLGYFAHEAQPGRRALAAYCHEIEQKLRFLRIPYAANRLLGIQVGAIGASVSMALATAELVWLSLIPVFILGPKLHLNRLVARRVAQVEELIEPWLNAVANALKASPSLGEAIAYSASLVEPPMSEEIDLLVKEYQLGTALDRALEQFAERIESKTLGGAVLALQVARNSGGDLPTTLENAASALRELARLEGVVRTKTAEGKAQAFVIGMIPVPMVLGIHHMDGHFFEPLVASFTGFIIIGGAVVLWAMAIALSMKILAVDV